MLQWTARCRIHPFCTPSKRLIEKRPADAAVGTRDQDCLVRNVHAVLLLNRDLAVLNSTSLQSQNAKHKLRPNVRSFCLIRSWKAHFSTHVPALSFRPATHTSEWSDKCLSQSGQGILGSDGFRSRHPPGDQSC